MRHRMGDASARPASLPDVSHRTNVVGCGGGFAFFRLFHFNGAFGRVDFSTAFSIASSIASERRRLSGLPGEILGGPRGRISWGER